MSDLDLDTIRQRAEAVAAIGDLRFAQAAGTADDGEWARITYTSRDNPYVSVVVSSLPGGAEEIGDFVVAAFQDVPALLAEIEQLREQARWADGEQERIETSLHATIDRLRAEHDEARATKDLHKARQEEYLLRAQQAEDERDSVQFLLDGARSLLRKAETEVERLRGITEGYRIALLGATGERDEAESERDALALHTEALEEDNGALHATIERVRALDGPMTGENSAADYMAAVRAVLDGEVK